MTSSSSANEIGELSRQIEDLSQFDPLTGLPNGALLRAHLHKAMSQIDWPGKFLALASLDFSGLKEINDRHGYAVGDQVLTLLAGRLKQALGNEGILARVGGDEFGVLFLDLPEQSACELTVARLLDAVAKPLPVQGLTLRMTASVGVALCAKGQALPPDQLVRRADVAMRRAQLLGENCYCFFDSALDRAPLGGNENIASIRQGFHAGEFALFYQPRVNMSTGKVVGAEALLRWQHPEKGLLTPGAFLSVIEADPLALELGEWVIGTALSQMAAWQERGLDIPVSVNVEARQVQQPGFIDRLTAHLKLHPKLKPGRLELEIREASALIDVGQISRLLNECKAIGVSFALDDFGGGQSSLSDLKRLPANVLKIDPSFVRGILDNPEDLSILEGVLGLATAFRRQSVAEGVENVDQGLMLLQLGCELAQGYAIARPMRAEEFPDWVATWRPDPRWTKALSVNDDERPLLYAGTEHRAWIASIEAYLRGEGFKEPQLDRHDCRLGAWLDVESFAGRNSHPDFQAISAQHWRLHALATGILKYRAQGRNSEAIAHVTELHGSLNKLVEHIEAFTHRG